MATYTVPGQGLTFNIPDEGEVFKTSVGGGNAIFVRSGNQVYSFDPQGLGTELAKQNGTQISSGAQASQIGNDYLSSLGIDPNSIATKDYNPADFRTAFGANSGSMGPQTSQLGFTSLLKSSADPAHAGEVITQGVSATNPNAPTFTSSTRGNITPAGIPTYGAPGAITPPANIGDYRNPNAQPGTPADNAANQINEQNQQQIFRQPGNFLAPNAPNVSSIGNPIAPPTTGGGSPALPQAQGGSAADTFMSGVASTLTSQQQSLATSLQQQQQSYQTRIDALTQQSKDQQNAQDLGMASLGSTVKAETDAKQATLEKEQQEFQQNYDARQKLVDQLGSLLTTGQQVIEQMKGTTGLSSIMNPRIAQTMTDVQGQAGVITASLSAYDSQIGIAQNQLQSATTAISSIYSDQIDYWKSVVTFYSNEQSKTDAQVSSLSNDQQKYVDAQIQMLQDNITQTRTTANVIQQAMLNPNTALLYAKAGVSLTDSIPQINQKIATQLQAQEQADTANKMASAGYSSTPIPNVTPVQVTDSQGKVTNYYKDSVTQGAGGTVGANGSPGSTSPAPAAGYKFSATQLNTGAANAAMDATSFKSLPGDVQNFYINSKPLVTAFNDAIASVKDGSASASQVKGNIDTMAIPDAVKTHLKSEVDAAAPAQAASSGGGLLNNIWGGIKGFFGF